MATTAPTSPAAARMPTMRWGAVFTGVVLAIGFVVVTTSLWSALAYSSDLSFFADSIGWWNAGSAVVALLLAGLVAGYLSRGGVVSGALHGLSAWGATIAGTLVLGTPAALATFTLIRAGQNIADAPFSLWPTFVAYTVGMVCAGVGGVLGGMARPAADGDEASSPSPTVVVEIDQIEQDPRRGSAEIERSPAPRSRPADTVETGRHDGHMVPR